VAKTKSQSWPDEIWKVLKDENVAQVAYVPDAGHTDLINRCIADNSIEATVLTSEQEGVAMLAGAWLGGERGALLMQSSGVGNCINMISVAKECRFPLLMIVTMRGEWGEFNPWQLPMGQGTQPALEAMEVIVQRVDDAARVGETVASAAKLAYDSGRVVAVLIGQRIIGFKDWRK